MDKPLSRSGLYTTAEKDQQYYRLWVEDDLQDLAQRCLGVRRWVQFRSAITVLSRFGYFATSSLLGKSTPGEEFCEAKLGKGSIMQKLLMILLNNDLKLSSDIPKPFIEMIKNVHMITFYLFGDFYELSKRATSITYLDSNQSFVEETSWKYDILNKFIGVISVANLIMNYQRDAGQASVVNDATPSLMDDDRTDIITDMLCLLCSSPRRSATSTLCGHVFCWLCIHNWLRDKNECPVCRKPTEPSRLIHLINFK